MAPRTPKYEIRYWVDGTRYHFAKPGQAHAFKRPGQNVVEVPRRVYDPDETLEFVLAPSDAADGL